MMTASAAAAPIKKLYIFWRYGPSSVGAFGSTAVSPGTGARGVYPTAKHGRERERNTKNARNIVCTLEKRE
jgi:hypothetical protein